MTEVTQEQHEQQERNYEAEASDMGWTPQEGFRGDPAKWVDAKTFVERGEKFLPLVRAENKTLKSEISELKNQLNELKTSNSGSSKEVTARIERMQKMFDIATQRQKEQLEQQYKQKKYDAVEVGDVDEYRRLEEEEKQHLSSFDEPQFEQDVSNLEKEAVQPQQQNSQQPQQAQLTQEQQKAVQDWQVKNEWYGKDEAMTNAAFNYHQYLLSAEPDLTTEQNLERVAAEINSRFKKDTSAPSLLASGARGASSPGKKAWADIPSDEQKTFRRFIDEGLFKDEKEAAEAYWS